MKRAIQVNSNDAFDHLEVPIEHHMDLDVTNPETDDCKAEPSKREKWTLCENAQSNVPEAHGIETCPIRISSNASALAFTALSLEDSNMATVSADSVNLQLGCPNCFAPIHSDHVNPCRFRRKEYQIMYLSDTFIVGTPFPCSKCSLVRRDDLETWKADIKTLECSVCSTEFVVNIGLHMHENEQGSIICGLCSVVVEAEEVSAHVFKHLLLRSCLLRICSTECLKKIPFHNTKNELLLYVCPICLEKKQARTYYLSHVEGHFGNRAFDCSQCDRRFSRFSKLRSHTAEKHGVLLERHSKITLMGKRKISRLRLACYHCDQKFVNKESLVKHIDELHFSLNLSPHSQKERPQFVGNEETQDFSCFRLLFPPYPKVRSNKLMFRSTKRIRKYYESVTVSESLFPDSLSVTRDVCLTRRKDLELVPLLNRSIPCSICGTKFKKELSLHIYEENDKIMFCSYCSGQVELSEIVSHQYEHIIERSFLVDICSGKCLATAIAVLPDKSLLRMKCFVCLKSVQRGDEWKRHVSMHLPEKEWRFECKECGLRYPVERKLNDHLLSHAQSLGCPLCPKTVESKAEVLRHLKSSHKNMIVVCLKCEKSFATPEDYVSHIPSCVISVVTSNVSEEETTICNKCGIRFPDLELKQSHQKECINTLRCAHCYFTCVSFDGLRKHIHQSHMPLEYVQKREKQCTVCGRSVAARFYQQHFATHEKVTGEYICDTCGKVFDNKTKYFSHIYVSHAPKDRFPCDKCSKAFAHKHHLRQHQYYNHTSDFPFQCKKCGNKFRRESNLRDHEAAPTACKGAEKGKGKQRKVI